MNQGCSQPTALGRSKELLEAQGGRVDVLGRAAHKNCSYKAQDFEDTSGETGPCPGCCCVPSLTSLAGGHLAFRYHGQLCSSFNY